VVGFEVVDGDIAHEGGGAVDIRAEAGDGLVALEVNGSDGDFAGNGKLHPDAGGAVGDVANHGSGDKFHPPIGTAGAEGEKQRGDEGEQGEAHGVLLKAGYFSGDEVREGADGGRAPRRRENREELSKGGFWLRGVEGMVNMGAKRC